MEFLKALFGDGEALTFEQLMAKAQEAQMKVVNLADGGYVSQSKFNDKTGLLNQQVTDLQSQLTQRDTDITNLRDALTAAQADATKLGDAQRALADMQNRYTTEKQQYEDRLSSQAYEFAVRERVNGLKFTSKAAKAEFMRSAIAQKFAMKDGNLLGFDDYVNQYKAEDSGTFAQEAPANPAPAPAPVKNPTVVLPSGGKPNPGKKFSLSELMRQKNENPDAQISYE